MEKSIDMLLAEMRRDPYTTELRLRCEELQEKIDEYETRNSFLKAEQETLSFNISNLKKRCDTLEEALLQKELECARLHQCLKKFVAVIG